MTDFVSPVDGHLHHGGAARDECAVCRLEADRDRWQAHAERVAGERDRLQAVADADVDEMSHIAFAVAGDRGAVHHDDILDLVKGVVAERDRLGMALEEEQEVRSEAVAERDRLRAVVDAATSDEAVERAARVYAEHLGHRAGIRACIRAALQSALDVSPTGEDT